MYNSLIKISSSILVTIFSLFLLSLAWRSLGSSWASTTATLSVGCFQNWEAAHQCVVDRHQGTRIIEFSTVVWCWKYSDELSTAEELIAVLNHLMCSANQIDVIFLQELLNDGFAKCIANASIILSPAALGLFRIRPKQVAQKAVLRYFSRSCNLLQLCYSDEFRGESTMHAKDLVIDEGCNWHAVEHVLELLPDADTVSSLALIVEAVDSVDLSALVVTA